MKFVLFVVAMLLGFALFGLGVAHLATESIGGYRLRALGATLAGVVLVGAEIVAALRARSHL